MGTYVGGYQVSVARSACGIFVLALLLASNLFASGEEPQLGFNLFAPAQSSAHWQYNSAVWNQLSTREPSLKISIGPSELVVSGALVETFRRPRNWSDLSLGEKILNFPVLNLFIPGKMPQPPGGIGKYFAWGERNQSWTLLAGAGAGGSAGTLMSLGW